MFGFDMNAIAAQLKAFQDQSERLVNAVEQIQKDIELVKEALNVPRETIEGTEYTMRVLMAQTEQAKVYLESLDPNSDIAKHIHQTTEDRNNGR